VTDSHNHLQDTRFDGIREDVIATMKHSGITRCVVNGTSPADWPQVADLALKHPDLIIPSFGLHPWEKPTNDWLDLLTYYLDSVPNACIGECGLDRAIKHYDIDQQTEVFTAQLALATERNLPISIHCTRAWGLLIDILESHLLPTRGFLLHSYAGSAELIPRLVKLGAYFSFSGSILKPSNRAIREIFQQVPTDRLLIETDAPNRRPPDEMVEYPLPGKTNHPANLTSIHQQTSHFIDTSLITNNFLRFFSVCYTR